MFLHKHNSPLPFPIQIHGWNPDTSSWDESLYPPLAREFTRRHNKASVHLTSNSPAIGGSLITFTARLECKKEDLNGNLLSDQHCEDANGQALSAHMRNWSSWLDYYGFEKCTDLKHCDVFPDRKPFPQSSDWRHKGYVYIWHTMGQYYETCDGSSSSLKLNTTDWTLGAGMMEVLVYRKQERRKYIPFSTDSTVFWVTDKIPLAVNISQKEAANITERNTFIKGYNIIFKVQVHDPSNYLKTVNAVDFIWDFHDGNQLITHSNVATHAYSMIGNITVKLVVQAAFRTMCPPPTTTIMHFTQSHTKGPHMTTAKLETTKATTLLSTTDQHVPTTTAIPSTEPEPTDPKMINATVTPGSEINFTSVIPTFLSIVHDTHFTESQCFRYMYGTFEEQIFIVEPHPPLLSLPPIRIVNVSAVKVANSTVNFVVTCLSSMPFSACTIVADSTCRQLKSIECDDVKPTDEGCQFTLKRAFQEPGTYCVNITLGASGHLALSTSTVTIANSSENNLIGSPGAAEVVLSSSAVLAAIFGVIAFILYRRNKMYRPVRRSMLEDAEEHKVAGSHLKKLRLALFRTSEERSHLLS
ncbi:protein QNR-71 isoform X2 [Trichomycterus rosablanca]|uniref:protein QNR-71 isoform X2 n=1 Tax=Trichomycterus rosablanca TaxID=2290929 RepID=UPI002F3546DC